MANRANINTEFMERVSLEEVSLFRVVPACMATKDGGATPTCGYEKQSVRVSGKYLILPLQFLPRKVPMKNGLNGTPITGEVMLMNQLGKNGVIRRKMI